MTACRVCDTPLGAPDYAAAAPAMTSMSTALDVPTIVHVCRTCGHVQSADLPDVQRFYDTDYRISLQSDEHDQLYAMEGSTPVFRTGHQTRLVLALALPQGARVLDFGAAKATTLQRLVAARPDIVPHVFDVSEDYRSHWQGWLPTVQQATYELPEGWAGRFDLITAHFVLEHVADPVGVLSNLARSLAPGGRLFLTVPDPLGNSGDLLVADHLNHFTASSLARALARAGLQADEIRQDLFRGAHVVVARAGVPSSLPKVDSAPALALLANWSESLAGLDGQVSAAGEGPLAVYGAGFYGTLYALRLGARVVCFLDRNPHLQGTQHLGRPVLAPEACPAYVRIVVAGLNPAQSRAILPDDAPWLPPGARVMHPAGST